MAAALGGLACFAPSAALAAPADRGPVAQYVVRAHPGRLATLDATVREVGTVVRQVRLIDADVARLRRVDAERLASDPRVASITRDVSVHLASAGAEPTGPTATLGEVADDIGAGELRARGITGDGVDVALVDSGVTPVAGLSGLKVVSGPDLSTDSQEPSANHADGYGHGTHMAGIIAGDDPASGVTGVAPGARLVSVKVADSQGNTDVSQVIAGIDWVVQHAHTDGLNVRVLNLSFGTDSDQSYVTDPLAFAAEQAWRAGIVVVTSAGNLGLHAHGLTDPASDPYVLAVAAADTTGDVTQVAGFSSRGDGRRNPDVTAPGVHIASLEPSGTVIDRQFGTQARTADGGFKGSGTSQAAAVVSGAAALLLDARPDLSPDQVKGLLVRTAVPLRTDIRAQGHGLVDVAAAVTATASEATQRFPRADGTGSLDASRGSAPLGAQEAQHGCSVNGQASADSGFRGQSWGSQSWASQSWASQSWASQSWASQSWASQSWASLTWG
ncbi:MAG: S8 family serine peptidase [Mycobacteriales bacterium]